MVADIDGGMEVKKSRWFWIYFGDKIFRLVMERIYTKNERKREWMLYCYLLLSNTFLPILLV